MSNLQAANGLAAAPNGTLYVASSQNSGIRVLDRQEDNSLVLDDLILTGVQLLGRVFSRLTME